MTAHEIEADAIAADGLKAGQAIWSAVEAAYSAGLNWKFARIAFDSAIEAVSDGLEWYAYQLFLASAYEAIPLVHLSAVERAEINRNAWDAHQAFVTDRRQAA